MEINKMGEKECAILAGRGIPPPIFPTSGNKAQNPNRLSLDVNFKTKPKLHYPLTATAQESAANRRFSLKRQSLPTSPTLHYSRTLPPLSCAVTSLLSATLSLTIRLKIPDLHPSSFILPPLY